MKKLLFILLFIIYSACLFGQLSAIQALDTLNDRIANIKKGHYEVKYGAKPAHKTDTVWHTGQVYFFKNQESSDSLAQFIGKWDDGSWVAYDGVFSYNIDFNKQFISIIEDPGNGMHALQNHYARQGIFLPYLYTKKPAFNGNLFQNALLKEIKQEDSDYLQIIRQDTVKNSPKLSSTDSDTAINTRFLDIKMPNFALRRSQEWRVTSPRLQYYDFQVTPIIPLSDSLTFKSFFINIDSLVKAGFNIQRIKIPTTLEEIHDMKIGQVMPDFTLPNLDGDTVQLSDFQDGWILFDFWFTTCYPCIKALPKIEKIHQTYKKYGLTVLGIHVQDEKGDYLKDFLKSYNISYSSLIDSKKVFTKKLGIVAFPLAVLMDAATKKIIYIGLVSDELENEIKKNITIK